MACLACSLKYENRNYIIANETSCQCVVFKRGSLLPPSKGAVLNTQRLHVPCEEVKKIYGNEVINEVIGVKNIYKVDIHKTLKLEQWCGILRFDAEIVSIPFVCKKHFSKKYFTEYVNPTSDFMLHNGLYDTMRIVSTPDNRNKTLEIVIEAYRLPKKIKGHKVIKLGEEIDVSAKTIICDVSKFETTSDLLPQSVNTTPRITKRKFEVLYPIKLAAGVVAFFGVLEVGSALISKVVNKIK